MPSAAPSASAGEASLRTWPRGACKARGQRQLSTIDTLRDDEAEIVAKDGAIFVLSFHSGLARARLTRLPRGGGPSQELAKHTGSGVPGGLIVADTAAYFQRKGLLLKVPLAGGDAESWKENWSRAFTVRGDLVYGILRGPGEKDQLVVVPREGGAPRTLAELPRSAGVDYRRLVVNEREAFISDWNKQQVLALSLSDGSSRVLAHTLSYPDCKDLRAKELFCQTAKGLLRLSLDGGTKTFLNDLPADPYRMNMASDARGFFLHQSLRYTDVSGVYHVPARGAPTTRIDVFSARGDVANIDDVESIAIDDECVYYAMAQGGTIVIKARGRPDVALRGEKK